MLHESDPCLSMSIRFQIGVTNTMSPSFHELQLTPIGHIRTEFETLTDCPCNVRFSDQDATL